MLVRKLPVLLYLLLRPFNIFSRHILKRIKGLKLPLMLFELVSVGPQVLSVLLKLGLVGIVLNFDVVRQLCQLLFVIGFMCVHFCVKSLAFCG